MTTSSTIYDSLELNDAVTTESCDDDAYNINSMTSPSGDFGGVVNESAFNHDYCIPTVDPPETNQLEYATKKAFVPAEQCPSFGSSNKFDVKNMLSRQRAKQKPLQMNEIFNSYNETEITRQPAENDVDKINVYEELSSAKKRNNPMYATTLNAKDNLRLGADRSLDPSCCFIICLCLILLVSIAALILSIIAIAMINNNQLVADNNVQAFNGTILEDLRMNIWKLQNENQQLRTQVDSLLATNATERTLSLERRQRNNTESISKTTAQVDRLLAAHVAYEDLLQSLTYQLNSSIMNQQIEYMNLTSEMSDLRTSLTESLNNVSKMAGPPGPPGAGNLSQCRHDYKSYGSTFAFEETQITLDMTSGDLRNWVLTGATCSTVGGTQAFLQNEDNQQQFECHCSGRTSFTAKSRFCVIDFWICPRVS